MASITVRIALQVVVNAGIQRTVTRALQVSISCTIIQLRPVSKHAHQTLTSARLVSSAELAVRDVLCAPLRPSAGDVRPTTTKEGILAYQVALRDSTKDRTS